MYGAVQAIGNIDTDTMDRYQAVQRKATKTIQKCNELLSATKKETDSNPEKTNGPPAEKVPRKTPKKIIC